MKNREVLLGVTGGIAAYKSADLCSKLAQRGAIVSVIMTESAHQFIGATTFEALTNRPVHSKGFEVREHYRGEHIGLAQRAEVVIIAPATASSIARIANGFADDLLSTTVLATKAPVYVAPAMNCEMWAKPSVQRNVSQIVEDGMMIVDPEDGWLSCGQVGAGRMAAPETILKVLADQFAE
ncbi:MAG: phosphopantothenoylcysteine decarboxylase [Fuerstiella sp.]|nr:phosphopantothenoylcysteine decarboxylase [Fuerstiella sp.]MCP4511469.1 phosphopantothenoylcysteine decarboxylase [Fuerstiella sp.]